jgi:hypothetical protein
MKFKITNLTGTKRDPKKRRRASANSKPVRLGRRHLPPAKSLLLALESVKDYRSQLSFYLTHEMISVVGPTLESMELFNEALYGPKETPAPPKKGPEVKAKEKKKPAPAKKAKEKVAEPSPALKAEDTPEEAPKKKRKKRTVKKKAPKEE